MSVFHFEFDRPVTHADTEMKSSRELVIEVVCRVGNSLRLMKRQQEHSGTYLKGFGGGQCGRRRGHQRRTVSVVIAVMFRQPETVDPVFFGEAGILWEFLVRPRKGTRICGGRLKTPELYTYVHATVWLVRSGSYSVEAICLPLAAVELPLSFLALGWFVGSRDVVSREQQAGFRGAFFDSIFDFRGEWSAEVLFFVPCFSSTCPQKVGFV